MRKKSVCLFGNRDGNGCGFTTFHANGASEFNPRNKTVDATTTANGDLAPMGRMMMRSMSAAMTNDVMAARTTAIQIGTWPEYHHAKNAATIAISPCAKFRWP